MIYLEWSKHLAKRAILKIDIVEIDGNDRMRLPVDLIGNP